MKTDKAYHLALRYLGRRPRSVKEMKDYLAKKQVPSGEITDIIRRLMDLNYLDDREFARQFIDNRIRFKPKSTYALKWEMRQKGISPEVADDLLASLDNMELAWSAARQKAEHWGHMAPETRKKKLMNHLRYRGFDHGVCLAVWERFQSLI
ncbi:MAG: regulatory protein RecX [Desulfobacter sp.]|nr:MAG: regulatory protein RecX [Desulfobacter sp.]